MISSIRPRIRAYAHPEHRLCCSADLWRQLLKELHFRGEERRESGAFLLGRIYDGRRHIELIVPFDDLDPHCLDSGIIELDGAAYGPLNEICCAKGLQVIADVHTHFGAPIQSEPDRTNPMIALAGHIALIVPHYARHYVKPSDLGIYEYRGGHRWHHLRGKKANRYFIFSWL